MKLWNSEYLKIWLGNFLMHFSFTLIVPLMPLYLSESFGADKKTIGLCLAGYTVMALIIRPISGYAVDRFPRKAVLIICNFVFFSLFAGYLAAGTLTLFTIFRTLHGAPFGASTVAASTVAIDVLPSDRRNDGIGYYGLSKNLAMATGPVIAVHLLQAFSGNFKALFCLSMAVSLTGLIINSTIRLPERELRHERKAITPGNLFLLRAWREALAILCYAFSFGVLTTYVVIYGREELGLKGSTGFFFTLIASGLILARLSGARSLRRNLVNRNAMAGVLTAACGFVLFASLHNAAGYFVSAFVIGFGNGYMLPAFQNMFINLAGHDMRGTANSSVLTSWDAGVGLGVLSGGVAAQYSGYHGAFWTAAAVNIAGVLYYFLKVRTHFEENKLR